MTEKTAGNDESILDKPLNTRHKYLIMLLSVNNPWTIKALTFSKL